MALTPSLSLYSIATPHCIYVAVNLDGYVMTAHINDVMHGLDHDRGYPRLYGWGLVHGAEVAYGVV